MLALTSAVLAVGSVVPDKLAVRAVFALGTVIGFSIVGALLRDRLPESWFIPPQR